MNADVGLDLNPGLPPRHQAPPQPRREREEPTLEVINFVLTLTSAFISVPSGTVSLTNCGTVPALVSTGGTGFGGDAGCADEYGCVLGALAATFLSNTMNADPLTARHIHKLGLADSFLGLVMRDVKGVKIPGTTFAPTLEPSGKLIMALPNVLTAISLMKAGARVIAAADHFPTLLSVFCAPGYIIPDSRCLLNKMAIIVGTGWTS